MPIETAQFIDTLQPDWPLGTDPESGGDDHLRMIKQVLKNTLPNINGQITGTPTQINNITLNTPWQDNSATAGALSNFNLTDPSKTDGSLAALAVATPTIAQANANTNLAMSIALFLQIQYPVGAEFRSYTDNRSPADILGFGTWEAVTGMIAGVGAVTDSQGYTQSYSAGQQGGFWRVQNAHIVAQQFELTMDAVPDHVHTETHAAPMAPASVYLRTDALSSGYVTQDTGPAGGHTPSGRFTMGAGAATDGTAFFNPYYGCYIWKRTA